MPDNQEVRYDVDGYEAVTTALRELLNTFPGIANGDIAFATLPEDAGLIMFPISGAVIQKEIISVTGKVTQVCQYPFTLTYRALGLSEERRAYIKEWLDSIGKWLEGARISIGGTIYKLNKYPVLTGGRKITSINRTTPAYLESINENQSEDWIIYLTLKYRAEFYRNEYFKESDKYET